MILPTFNTYEEFETAKSQCELCPVGKCYNKVVLSEGCKKNPNVVLVGEAPGADEVTHGRPFIGRCGQVLRKAIRNFGYNKGNTLITNTMPCRPPSNQYPDDVEIVGHCMLRWLWNELLLTKPNVIVLLGSKALSGVLDMAGIMSLRGTVFDLEYRGVKAKCIPTYHPSFVMRKRGMKSGPKVTTDFLCDLELAAEMSGILDKKGA